MDSRDITIHLDSDGVSLVNINDSFKVNSFTGLVIAVYGVATDSIFLFSLVDATAYRYTIRIKCIDGNKNNDVSVRIIVAK